MKHVGRVSMLLAAVVLVFSGLAGPAVAAGPDRIDPVSTQLRQVLNQIRRMPLEDMNIEFMRDFYRRYDNAAAALGQIMADPQLPTKNAKLGKLRAEMDLKVWEDVLKQHPALRIEITDQGRDNGIRSDREYTLYYHEEEAGIALQEIIAAHGAAWQARYGLTPAQLEIKVWNGNDFYPDWRCESLTTAEHQAQVKKTLLRLRRQPEAYYVPGANRTQTVNRALYQGRTSHLQYDPIKKRLATSEGPAGEVAERYQGVAPMVDRANAFGSVVQNSKELLEHQGGDTQEAIRRAKYLNRVVDDGLVKNTLFMNTYQEVERSNLPADEKLELKTKMIKRVFDRLDLSELEIMEVQRVIDVSMKIEIDKIQSRAEYERFRKQYFADEQPMAELAVDIKLEGRPVTAAERQQMVLAEQEFFFYQKQKRVMAYAIMASLEEAAVRDLTPKGAMRNALKFVHDAETGRPKAVFDVNRVKKVAFERATEAALLFEIINTSTDPQLRGLSAKAIRRAPTPETQKLFRKLSTVTNAEIDNFLRDDPQQGQSGRLQMAIDDFINEKVNLCRRAGIHLVESDEAAIKISDDYLKHRIVTGHMVKLPGPERISLAGCLNEVKPVAFEFGKEMIGKATPLMVTSSVVNMVRAYQTGNENVMIHALYCEWLNYTPDFVEIPFTILDGLMRAQQGDYSGAWYAMRMGCLLSTTLRSVGTVMIVVNIAHGTYSIADTYIMTRTNDDFVEQAFRARHRDNLGKPYPAGVKARRNPHKEYSSFRGETPGFPLFGDVDEIKGPEDDLTDSQLAEMAVVVFSATIDSLLKKEGLKPHTPAWTDRARHLSFEIGFDIPYYARMIRMYNHFSPEINRSAARGADEDVLLYRVFGEYVDRWFDAQPVAYRTSAEGAYSVLFKEDKEEIKGRLVDECVRQYQARERVELEAYGKELEQQEKLAQELLAKLGAVEKRLLATEQKLTEELGDARVKETEKAVADAKKLRDAYRPQVWIDYPFTYATEEFLPVLDVKVRSLYENAAHPLETVITEEVGELSMDAPAGWEPISDEWKEKFEKKNGDRPAYLPVTVIHKYKAEVKDAKGAAVGEAEIEIPIVYYLENTPAFAGGVSVRVFGGAESGDPKDSFPYEDSEVTLGAEKDTTDRLGGAGFSGLDPGSYTVTAKPYKGDQNHEEASGSATVVDLLETPDAGGEEWPSVQIILPYKKPPKDDEQTADASGEGDETGGSGAGEGTGAGSGAGAGGDEEPGAGEADLTRVVADLQGVTTALEAERDQAKQDCKYAEAAAVQARIVTTAENFLNGAFAGRPGGVPPELFGRLAQLKAELLVLNDAATAEKSAKEYLKVARAEFMVRDVEAALTSLETAMLVPNIPKCLYDPIRELYDEVKADVGDIMKLIDEAVKAANQQCDYARALAIGNKVRARAPTLSWVEEELPRIEELAKRQLDARALLAQAEAGAAKAQQMTSGGQKEAGEKEYAAAMKLAEDAVTKAPKCDKDNLQAALDGLQRRKQEAENPVIERSLLLLMDTSGSMSGDKLTQAKTAATQAIQGMTGKVEVAVVSYSGGCQGGWSVVQGFTTDRQALIQAVEGLGAGGGTPMAPAVGFAQQYMETHARGKTGQILLLCDGQNDCGSVAEAGDGLRRSSFSVRIDAVGFGLDEGSQAENELGELVTAAGNGRQYSANDASELITAFRRVFVADQIKPVDPLVGGADGAALTQLFESAIYYLRLDDPDSALPYLEGAVGQFPTSAVAEYNLSLGYEADQQIGKAITHGERYLTLSPHAFDEGMVKQRLDQLRTAQQGRRDFDPGGCRNLVGWAQTELGRVGGDAARRARVYRILVTAQRGDCEQAQREYRAYTGR